MALQSLIFKTFIDVVPRLAKTIISLKTKRPQMLNDPIAFC